MKLTIYKGHAFSLKVNTFELECPGKGTKEDPILITSKKFNDFFIIMDSELHIHIKDCKFDQFGCSLSKNIIVEKCELNFLKLRSCTDIQIKEAKGEFFDSIKSNNCSFFDCISSKGFGLFKSNNNVIKNCILQKRLDIHLSSGNHFENNQIQEKYKEKTKDQDLIQIKNTFDFVSGKRTSGEKFYEIECEGSGFEKDQFIIEPLEDNYKTLTIEKSIHYAILKNFTLKSLLIALSANKTIENCKVRFFYTNYADKIKIKNVTAERLTIDTTDNLLIENSNIGKLVIHNSNDSDIIINNCKIEYMKKKTATRFGLQT